MWPFRVKEAPASTDKPVTGIGPLVERLESLERRMAALQDDVAEAQDTIARRFEKYRKRLEREPEGAPELSPQESTGERRTGGLPPLRVVDDEVAIRRSRGGAGPSTRR